MTGHGTRFVSTENGVRPFCLLLAFIVSCSTIESAPSAASISVTQTSLAATVSSIQTKEAVIPSATPTLTSSPSPSATSQPTSPIATPTQTSTQTATVTMTVTPKLNTPTVTRSPTIPGCISWEEVASHVNQTRCVCGPVARASYMSTTKGQPTYLDLGRAYPEPSRFEILIWGNDRRNFPSAPETYYKGKTICATGKITSYQGACEMEVTTAAQIQIQ
jgi:hypothetical protein